MKKVYDVFCKAQEILISIIMIVMVAVVLIATFCRYTQLAVLNWPDELTRYLMVWMVFIGAGAASKNKAHFEITAVYDSLGKAGKYVLLAVKMLLTNGLYVFMIVIGMQLVRKLLVMGQVSPAMHVPMWFMYLAVPAGFILMMLQGFIADMGTLKQINGIETGGNRA